MSGYEVKSILDQVSRPTAIKTAYITKSAGSSELVEPLFLSPTPNRRATIHRSPTDIGVVYIGGGDGQHIPFNPGDRIETRVTDLSRVYVKIPVGVSANIYVLWEV